MTRHHPLWNGGEVTFGVAGLSAQTASSERLAFGEELRNAVDYAEVAGSSGFSALWATEHHFADDGYLPAPWVLLAAIAERVPHLSIGTNVAVPGLSDPIRFAEDVCVLDQLSAGRLVLGLGLGYRRAEFEAFGRNPAARVQLLGDAVAAVRAAAAREPVRSAGRGDAVISPPPHRPEGPPILIGAFVQQGVRRARSIGDGYIAPDVPLRTLEQRLDWLTEDKPLGDEAVVATLSGFVGDKDVALPGVLHVQRLYDRWLRESGDAVPRPGAATDDSGARVPSHLVWGSPEQCAEALLPTFQRLQRLPGSGPRHLCLRLTYPAVAVDANLASIADFGQKVIPMVREMSRAGDRP